MLIFFVALIAVAVLAGIAITLRNHRNSLIAFLATIGGLVLIGLVGVFNFQIFGHINRIEAKIDGVADIAIQNHDLLNLLHPKIDQANQKLVQLETKNDKVWKKVDEIRKNQTENYHLLNKKLKRTMYAAERAEERMPHLAQIETIVKRESQTVQRALKALQKSKEARKK